MITEFMVNPAAVEDNQGEWFEITNTNPQDINLSGLIIADAAGEHVIQAVPNARRRRQVGST